MTDYNRNLRGRRDIDLTGILRKGRRLGDMIDVARNPDAEMTESASTELVLNLVAATLRTNMGTDDEPSPLLVAITNMPGVETADVELAQDLILLSAEIVETVRDNLDTPEALPFLIPATIGMDIGELKDDVEAVKD